jgi:integrase
VKAPGRWERSADRSANVGEPALPFAGTLRDAALCAFDRSEEFARWVIEHAGIETLLNARQIWSVGDEKVPVSLWFDLKQRCVLRVHDGRKQKSLCLAAVYAAKQTGKVQRLALALAGYAGLRLGELRALAWEDVDLAAKVLCVHPSLLPDGPIAERNLRQALDDAKVARRGRTGPRGTRSGTRSRGCSRQDLELPATTLAQLVGHADAGFTLSVYARDGRDTSTVVADVLERAARAGVGS